MRVREATVHRLLKRHRIRRLTAAGVVERLKAPKPSRPPPETMNAATAHLEAVAQRLDLVNRQIGEANDRIDHLTERLADGEENAKGQLDEQRDVTILRSLPGVWKDRPRHAARRSHGCAAKGEITTPCCMPVGRRASHQAIGQEQNRSYETGRSRPPAQRRLPLGAHRRAA